MAARVTILGDMAQERRVIEVPKANGYEIDERGGGLVLRTSSWGGDRIAFFKRWDEVVIESDRGPNGRFVKRGR